MPTDIYSQLDALDQQSSGGGPNNAGVVAKDAPWLPATSQQEITHRLNLWSTAAPALTPELLLNFAESGVSPTDAVGQWVIRTGVPALGARAPQGQQNTDQQAALRTLSAPGILFQLAQLPLDKMTRALKLTAAQVGHLDDEQLSRLFKSGSPDVKHGFWNKVGDIATTGTRGALTGLAAPYEAVQGVVRARSAMGAMDPTAAAASGGHVSLEQTFEPRYGKTIDTHDFMGMKTDLSPGKKVTYGSPSETFDILGQTELGQALKGESLGHGFFPAGTAHEQAVLAQQSAAAINGHAMTPGRALAASVVQPGSRPYSIMSGVVDTAVALKGDPGALVLSELSSVAKGARLFSPSSDEAILQASLHLSDLADTSEKMVALRSWAGAGDNLTEAMAQKLKSDPGSVQQLIEAGIGDHASIAHAIAASHAGMFNGLRNAVHPNTALEWLNGKAGREYADWAASHDFTDIWQKAGKKMPADVAAQLADATNADDVRAILGHELGTTIRGVPETVMPYAAVRPFETVRWGHYLPRGYVDVENGDAAVEQAMRTLIAAKVPRERWDDILRPVAYARNQPEMFDAYVHNLGNAVKQTLVERGVEPSLAKTLTRFFPDDWEQQRRFFVDEVGNTPHVPGLTVGGAPVPIDGPHLPSELLNRSIPPLDMRAIHRQVGLWGKAYNTPGLSETIKLATYAADSVTGTFKALVLLRLALPIRNLADEQARMATAGADSMFHNPLSWIAWSVGHKGEADVLGEKWAENAGDLQSTFRAAVGQSNRWKNDIFQPDQIFAKHWVTYDRQSSKYLTSHADELSQLHIDPVAREVAKAVQNIDYAPAYLRDVEGAPHGVDGIKQWFWDGPGHKYRQELAAANLWGGASSQLMHDRAAADQYIDSVIDRIHIKTSGNDTLIDAVAGGKPFKGGTVDKQFMRQLSQLHDAGIGPATVKGRATVSAGRTRVIRNTVDRIFGALMDHPTQTLTRSPMFKQTYWQRVGELLPYADETTQEQLVRVARNTGIKLAKPTAAQGVIGLEQVDTVAKAYGLKATRDLLYLPGERIGATEVLRNIMPFGEAWRDVFTNWAQLAAQHPVAVRRVQQGVTAARESGFFHPQTDQNGHTTEVFTMVPSGIMDHLAGVPFPLTAKATGINIIGSGLPGVGPVVQIPASMFLPRTGAFGDFKKLLMPYGEPDSSGGAFEMFFPGWVDRLKTTGYFGKTPFLGQSPDQKRILDGLTMSVFTYKMSSGSYDLSNPDVLEQLVKDSQADAQKLTLFRGMAQFVSPSAPGVDPQAKLKDGSIVELAKLTGDFRQILAAHADDLNAAVSEFVTKYGPERIFATEPHARRVVFGVPTSSEGLVFRERHSGFANKFPTTYGYWVPQTGAFDYPAYLDAIARGDIEPLKVDEWAKLADARLGNAIYDQARKRLPVTPSVEQRNWLTDVKRKIATQYPGFDDDSLKVSRKNRDQTIDELRKAIVDPTAKGTPLADAAGTYISARDRALAAARQRTGRASTTLSGARMEDLRGWLYQVGNQIALQKPEFTNMWNDVFMGEVEPVEEP